MTAPFALTLLGGHDAASTTTERLGGIGVAAGVHVVCGLIGLAAAWAELATASHRIRLAIVIVALLLIGTMRPLLISWFTQQAGLPAFPVPMSIRLATNVLAVVVATTMVAILVDSLRRRSRTVSQLGVVAAWLEADRTHGERLVAEAGRMLGSTRRLLLVQLRALEQRGAGLPAPDRAQALREFALTVVRPSSSRVFELRESDALERALDQEPQGARPPERRELRIVPATVGVPIGLYTLLLMPFVFARLPIPVALLAALAAGVTGSLGEVLLARTVARVSDRRWSAVAVVAGTGATGAAILAVTTPIVGSVALLPTAPVLYAVLGVMCAAVASLTAELRAQESMLSDRIRTYRADEHDGRRRADQRLLDAAQELHGEVQSICLVAAARLERGEGDLVWEAAVTDARRVVEALDAPRALQPVTAEATVRSLLDGWGRVIAIRYQADDGIWELADRRPEILQPLVDAMSESLTNILRHSTERAADIMLTATDGRIRLTVESSGGIASITGDGIGLRALRARVESVDLRQHGETVRLTVSFDLQASVES
ncbi:hypothetical protein KXS11_12835 [Plantibacter flavus]